MMLIEVRERKSVNGSPSADRLEDALALTETLREAPNL